MSFSRPPTGLVYGDSVYTFAWMGKDGELDSNAYFPCIVSAEPEHVIVECHLNLAGNEMYELDISALDLPPGDFYSVFVRMVGPRLGPGHENCGPGGEDGGVVGAGFPPCIGVDPTMYDGVVEGGDWVISSSGVPVANTYGAEADEAGFSRTHWPDPTTFIHTALMVNPSPTWPVPDTEGNEFGKVLFTLAQLPAAVSTTIDHFNYDCIIDGYFHVLIQAYVIGEEEELPFQNVTYVGAA